MRIAIMFALLLLAVTHAAASSSRYLGTDIVGLSLNAPSIVFEKKGPEGNDSFLIGASAFSKEELLDYNRTKWEDSFVSVGVAYRSYRKGGGIEGFYWGPSLDLIMVNATLTRDYTSYNGGIWTYDIRKIAAKSCSSRQGWESGTNGSSRTAWGSCLAPGRAISPATSS